jgi:uncharacterized membrane-anchored protein
MIAFDRAAARRLLRGIAEPSEGVVGIVLAPGADWRLIISDAETGFLDDADASSLDAGELIAAYTEGNRARNDRRQAIGAPALLIDGWAEPPRYDRGAHRLTWSLAGHTDRGPLVNSFTRILGRHGFLSVTLVDTTEAIGRSRQQVSAVLGAIRFRPGSRYEDHQAGDRRAIGGLRGLVIGPTEVTVGAAPGLLARIVARLRRSMLVILAILVGIGGLIPRLLARRMRSRHEAMAPAGEPPDDVDDTEEITSADLIALDDAPGGT